MPLNFLCEKTRRFRLLWKLMMTAPAQDRTAVHLQISRVGEAEFRVLVEFYGSFYEVARDGSEKTASNVFHAIRKRLEEKAIASPAELAGLVHGLSAEEISRGVDETEENPITRLSTALKSNDKGEVNNLLESFTPSSELQSDGCGQTMLHVAASEGRKEVVERLLEGGAGVNHADFKRWTPLHCSCNAGHLNVCLSLLSAGADVNAVEVGGCTPLHYLAKKKQQESDSYLYLQVLREFFIRGASINVQNESGETPLHRACYPCCMQQLLPLLKLSKDPDVNIQNKRGETCLHYAVRDGRKDVVTILLEFGGDPKIKGDGGNCFDIARNGKLVDILHLLDSVSSFASESSSVDQSESQRPTSRTLSLSTNIIVPSLREVEGSKAAELLDEAKANCFSCTFEKRPVLFSPGKLYITKQMVLFQPSNGLSIEAGGKVTRINLDSIICFGVRRSYSTEPYLEVHTYDCQVAFRAFIGSDADAAYQRLSAVWADGSSSSLHPNPDAKTNTLPLVAQFPPPPVETSAYDIYGFSLDASDLVTAHRTWLKNYKTSLEAQRKSWSSFFGNCSLEIEVKNESSKIKKVVRKGIPYEYRGQFFYRIAKARRTLKNHPDYYASLLSQLMSSPSKVEIEKDISRTCSFCTVFQQNEDSKAALRRVLSVYSVRNPTIGYCQSMSGIAAFLLLLLPEEHAFWTLTYMVEDLLPNYFSDNIIGSVIDQKVFHHVMAIEMPGFYTKCDRLYYPVDALTSGWFLGAFVNHLPTEGTLRVWDWMFIDGPRCLFVVAAGILKSLEKEVMACTEGDQIVKAFHRFEKNAFDCDLLIKTALQHIRLFPKPLISQLRAKYWSEVMPTL